MIKSIIYLVVIVATLAWGWFSYGDMKQFEQDKDKREALDGLNDNRKVNIKKTKKDAKAMEGQLKLAKSKLNDAENGLDNAKSKLKLSKNEAAKWKSDIATQTEKLDKVKDLIESIKKAFADLGEDIELNQIPALVQKLEDDLKKANKDLEELQALTEAADTRVASNNTQITDLDVRIAKRADRMKGNSAQGRITAVNHDWGFVTIEIPSNMPVTAEAKLMIKRGMSYIGNLKINAIEGRRIVADIDYKSMTPGLVVQPGDHVILAKPVTN